MSRAGKVWSVVLALILLGWAAKVLVPIKDNHAVTALSVPAASTLQVDGIGKTVGSLGYTWHRVATSRDSDSPAYEVQIDVGRSGRGSADSIAVYLADYAEGTFGSYSPLTVAIYCGFGPELVHGVYTRDVGGTVDITWRSYDATGALADTKCESSGLWPDLVTHLHLLPTGRPLGTPQAVAAAKCRR